MNRKVLIIGASGSGKTYYASQLKKLGINAVDADLLDGLCSWYDEKGDKVMFPNEADKEFLDSHKFLWDIVFLNDYLNNDESIYLFGLSDNVFEMTSLFDEVYFLSVSEETLVKRLASKDRENPMGKTEQQREEILKSVKLMEKKAQELGIEIIDGTLSPRELAKEIA